MEKRDTAGLGLGLISAAVSDRLISLSHQSQTRARGAAIGQAHLGHAGSKVHLVGCSGHGSVCGRRTIRSQTPALQISSPGPRFCSLLSTPCPALPSPKSRPPPRLRADDSRLSISSLLPSPPRPTSPPPSLQALQYTEQGLSLTLPFSSAFPSVVYFTSLHLYTICP